MSAVCTAPEARGRGHAARVVSALVARITARGERPFLHVAEKNTVARSPCTSGSASGRASR
ncbi:GNAT family N-acetyltransferase [Rhodococcus sp. T7]|uniref:GNAT family N-acetyltransferase n=1 Tax=Rhodococcus sp. T7 TaxID=627444 RepID=UPI001F22288C|nr:GNAT family N-acetyltransferase [Rhodococcus sp. T7]